jgi:hypothetical protein
VRVPKGPSLSGDVNVDGTVDDTDYAYVLSLNYNSAVYY